MRDADLRGRDGLFLCEGRQVVRRAIASGRFPLRSVFLTPPALEALRAELERLPAATPVYVAPQSLLSQVVGFDMHRGCVAAADRGPERPPSSLPAPAGRPSLLLALEHLTNPDNVGGIFRNARAFGADGVLLCPRCSDPLYRKAVRVSIGGVLEVPFARAAPGEWPGALETLRTRGYRLAALDPRGDSLEVRELAHWVRRAPRDARRVVLLLGTEGEGLSEELRACADWRVRIDMEPGVDSLNVATAGAVALHHLWSALRLRAEGTGV